MIHAYNLNTQEDEAEDSLVQRHPRLCSEILPQRTEKSWICLEKFVSPI